MNAARIKPTQTEPNVLLRLDLNNGGNGGNTLCNGTGIIDASGSGGLKQSLQITSTTFTDYVFNYTSLLSVEPYLVIAAIPQSGISNQTILIRKITIEETPPAVTFTLSPSSPTISCGSTTPQTFTVTNVHNTPNVTNHLWNLGANNGWIYNGSPASSTISTGTINTLTLTPSCSDTKQNISVTVTAGGNNYQTNTSAITNSSPSLSISGSSALCSGTGAYSISNLSCNATVSWSSSNTGIATITSTGNPATVTTTGSGKVTIMATINGVSCLSNNTIYKTVQVGVPSVNDFDFLVSGPSCIGSVSTMSFGVGFNGHYGCQLHSDAGITDVEWQIYCSNPYQVTYNDGNFTCQNTTQVNNAGLSVFFSYYPTQPYVITFRYRVKNGCDWSLWSPGNSVLIQACGGGWGFTISPNPIDGIVQIALDENTIKNDKSSNVREIQIMDKFGKIVKKFNYGFGIKKSNINISELKADIYFIKVFNGKEWKGKQVIKY